MGAESRNARHQAQPVSPNKVGEKFLKLNVRRKRVCYDFGKVHTVRKSSHDKRIVALVRFLARRAAEIDYAAHIGATATHGVKTDTSITKGE